MGVAAVANVVTAFVVAWHLVVGIALEQVTDLGHRLPHVGEDLQEEMVACLLDAPCLAHVASCPTLGPYPDDLALIVQQNLWLSDACVKI